MELKIIVALVIAVNLCDFTMTADVPNSFKENEIVPDAVDVAPQDELKITYPSGVSVNFGNELTPTQVKDVPNVEWTAEDGQLYTLLMVDPDAPSRNNPSRRSWKHWAVINILGTNVAGGDVIAGYVGAGPPDKTGLHRYVFLVYKQTNGPIEYNGPIITDSSAQDRPSWSAVKFANDYNLGSPIAGNFFQAQYDDYVPTLHAKLSGK